MREPCNPTAPEAQCWLAPRFSVGKPIPAESSSPIGTAQSGSQHDPVAGVSSPAAAARAAKHAEVFAPACCLLKISGNTPPRRAALVFEQQLRDRPGIENVSPGTIWPRVPGKNGAMTSVRSGRFRFNVGFLIICGFRVCRSRRDSDRNHASSGNPAGGGAC